MTQDVKDIQAGFIQSGADELSLGSAYKDFDAQSAMTQIAMGSSTFWSYVRTLVHSTQNSDKLNASNIAKKADIVFNATIVIRNNLPLEYEAQANASINEDEENDDIYDDYYDSLFQTAASVVESWFGIAKHVYDGINPKLSEIEPIYNSLPKRMPTHVTVFGQIVDKEGRSVSLTLTEQSDLAAVYKGTAYALGFYDWTTELTGDIDLDKHMKRKYRWAQDLGVGRVFEKNPGTRNKADKKEIEKLKPIVLKDIDEMLELDLDTYFTIPIKKVELITTKRGDLQLRFSGERPDANGNAVLANDFKDALYIYQGRNDYDNFIEWINKEYNVSLSDNPSYTFEKPIVLMSMKKSTASGGVYYPEIKIPS